MRLSVRACKTLGVYGPREALRASLVGVGVVTRLFLGYFR